MSISAVAAKRQIGNGIGSLKPDLVPITVLAVLVLVALGWNAFSGFVWRPTLPVMSIFPVLMFAIAWFYSSVRPVRPLAEIALYLGMWFLFPAIISRLTYLGAALGYPLIDNQLAATDLALGFDWRAWVGFVEQHAVFKSTQALAYESYFWQPIVAVVLIAMFGKRGDNAEFMTTILVAAGITTLVATFFPAVGPAEAYGMHLDQGRIIAQIRSTPHAVFSYSPIVTFPSFHTVMAIVFTATHRGSKWRLMGFGLLNFAMLISIPFWGDHYASDMVAGAAIALISISVSSILVDRQRK